jgi:peptidyl-prolyl cis-trans isomerase C
MRFISLLTLLLGSAFVGHALANDAPAPTNDARRARVFAKIGSVTITVGDLEDAAAMRKPYSRRQLAESAGILRTMADAQVENELFYQGAKKRGYANDPKVEKRVNQTMVKIYLRKEIEEAVSRQDIPEDQVVAYYQQHPEEFRREETRRARHILLASEKEANEILAILRGEERLAFRALAKQRSIDTETNIRGGDLLYFNAAGDVVGRESDGKVDMTLVNAAFALGKTGQFAGPLDLGDGKWSILELTAIRPERVKLLDEASSGIRHKLWLADRQAALDKRVVELRQELAPEIRTDLIDAIVLTPAASPSEPAKP